ncbi:MAG: phosphodiesterase [Burkholderiales bacterium]|nr:phosphodiesterase [Burkholderiales bacterium]
MLIAQISDLHVTGQHRLAWDRFDTAASLERCITYILRRGRLPDVVLATGDLVDCGTEEEYRRLRGLLELLPMPLYLIPGNHDDRRALRAEFADHDYLPRTGDGLHYAVEHHAVRLVALDTVVAGADGGTLDPGQLDWLETTLAAKPHAPTLVFMHHPPVATGMQCMDGIALDATSASRLGVIIAANPQVERIVCGHVHRGVQARWRGTAVSICPSTAFQAQPALDGGDFAASEEDPPAYQLHYWSGSELVTHTLSV